MAVRAAVPVLTVLILVFASCSPAPSDPTTRQTRNNPFLEDQQNHGKADSAYFNPDGIEVEVDLEGDLEGLSRYQRPKGPALLAQFAQTFLRSRRQFYLQSVNEAASSAVQTEWLVDGAWLTTEEVKDLDPSKFKHFRLRGIDAVLLHDLAQGVKVGDTFQATVPLAPFSLFADVGDACATSNSHISVDQHVYWYLWKPNRASCKAKTQELTLRITKVASAATTTYPEYDKLIEDGKVTAVMLFGRVGDGDIAKDLGMELFNSMGEWLEEAGFSKVPDAPVGVRYRKHIGDVDFEIDLYSPEDFAGLTDTYNLLNFDTAVTQHEIVIYQGHSLLGASNLWGNQRYPDSYQIFLYGGCLGYEYYMKPILQSKGGWDKLDVISSVVPVPADSEPGAAFIAKLAWSLGHGYAAAWRDLLGAIRHRMGNSTFGVSGVRDNAFSPDGETSSRYEYNTPFDIPDGVADGVSTVVEVPSSLVAKSVTVALDVSHESISDLTFTLEHDGVSVVVWDQAEEGDTIRQTFTLDEFAGKEAKGVWTLKVVDQWQVYVGQVKSWALIVQR